MNFNNLKYFLVTAEELNITKAASRLFITQQTLSSHIRRMEDEIGSPLFERSTPLKLTPVGEAFLKHAETIVLEEEMLIQDIHNIKNEYAGDLTISIARERANFMLPQILEAFHREYPYVAFHILEGSSSQKVDDLLYQGKADCSIGLQITDNEAITSRKLCNESPVLVVPNSIIEMFFINKGKDPPQQNVPVRLDSFYECPFITFNRNTMYRSYFAQQCRNENFTPRIVAEADTSLSVLALCCTGLGIAICPRYLLNTRDSVLKFPNSENLSLYTIQGGGFEYNICLNYYSKKESFGILKAFADFITRYFMEE